MNVDPDGTFWDTVLDLFFITWDIYDLITDDGWKNLDNWGALLVDIAFAAIPFVTGGGQMVKLANIGDDINNLTRTIVIGETMDRVEAAAKLLNTTDNIYGGFDSYQKLSKLKKGGKALAEICGKTSNIAWLFGKLQRGYRVVDIGLDAERTARSSSYIVERIILFIWQTRNVWKWVFHLDLE